MVFEAQVLCDDGVVLPSEQFGQVSRLLLDELDGLAEYNGSELLNQGDVGVVHTIEFLVQLSSYLLYIVVGVFWGFRGIAFIGELLDGRRLGFIDYNRAFLG